MFSLAQQTGSLPLFRDKRGKLFVAEEGETIPFSIKRVFFIKDVPKGESRANHIYKNDEMAVCLSGNCKIEVKVQDETRTFVLKKSADYVIIPGCSWRRLYDFSSDCVLAVLCDTPFSEDDYSY